MSRLHLKDSAKEASHPPNVGDYVRMCAFVYSFLTQAQQLGEVIGRGAYGCVYKGVYKTIMPVVNGLQH